MPETAKTPPDLETLLAVRLDEALGEALHPLFLARIAEELSDGALSDRSRSAMTSEEVRLAHRSLANAASAGVRTAA